MWKRKLSIYAIAKYHLHVAPNTVKIWCAVHGLDKFRAEYQKTEKYRAEQQQANSIDGELVLIDEVEIAEVSAQGQGAVNNINQPSLSNHQPSTAAALPGNPFFLDPDECKSAYDSLTYSQQAFVDLYVEQRRLPKNQHMTQIEIADKLGRHQNTISDYLAHETIREAINDASDGDYRF